MGPVHTVGPSACSLPANSSMTEQYRKEQMSTETVIQDGIKTRARHCDGGFGSYEYIHSGLLKY